jgi:hypothetical protein
MRTFAASAAAAVLALLLAPAAWSGGFATVGIDFVPASAAAGGTWTPEFTVLQHGRTPTDGLRAAVLLTSGGRVERFAARPTGRPGTYTATVKLPSAGRWQVAVDEGFGAEPHRFGSIAVGGEAADTATPSPASDGDDGLLVPLLAALGAGVLAAVLTALLGAVLERRRAPRTFPAAP